LPNGLFQLRGLRELALQGVDALLVEKSDFCSGASSASTRVIHGGLRYLENGEFRLVKESVRERVHGYQWNRPWPYHPESLPMVDYSGAERESLWVFLHRLLAEQHHRH